MCQKFRDALAAWNTERYVSMRQCAEAFGVPRTSLNDMIREGRTEWRGKGGKSNKAKSTAKSTAKTVAKTTNKTPAARRKRASATVTSSSATATTVEPDQSGSNSQEAESEPVVKTNANEKKDKKSKKASTNEAKKTVEQKIAVRGQRDKVEASSKQLEEQKKGIKIKQEMLSSSSVPSASDTSTHTDVTSSKSRKRKGTMAPDGVASDTPVPPIHLIHLKIMSELYAF